MRKLFLSFTLLMMAMGLIRAQEAPPPKIFLNCTSWNCFEDFIRTELSFFDYVRDRFEADIQVLVISQENAAGGDQYTLTFLGSHHFTGMQDTLTFSTRQTDTDDMVRNQMLRVLKQGLLPFVLKTPLAQQIEVSFPTRKVEEALIQEDPWNYWVFNIGSNAFFDGESNRSYLSVSGNVSASRITPQSKLNLNANYDQNITRFDIDNTTFEARNKSYNIRALYVKSLGEHWGVGAYYRGFHSVFENIDFSQILSPALEYSVFPIADNTRRQFRIIYQAGVRHQYYLEETIFDKNSETLPFQRLNVILNYTQPWGTLETTLFGSQFLHDAEKFRVGLNISLSWRIIEGLSLDMWGGFNYIKDQISLARSEVDESVFLLNGRQLPTSLNYYSWMGLSYTFGSINNSVVNPRLNGID